jgi:lipoprotein-anchoring transpeptidase ErfK/SrfK
MTTALKRASRSLGNRRGAGALALVLIGAAIGCAAANPALASASAPARSQELVILRQGHVARAAPNAHAHRIETVAARRPLTRVPTALPVLGHSGPGGAWLRVLLPGRPNGHTGWISANRTRSGSTAWRIEVSLSARRVTVFHDGRAIRRYRAVVGKPSTPTPRGRFFVEEVLALGSAPGAPFALATSARSNALQEFDGGPGQIAVHGTRYLSGRPGTAASHGCVRLPTRAITWLAKRIGAGVPLTIGR